MSDMPKETKKKDYCKKGTRRNHKTGNCDPVNQVEGNILQSIKEAVLSLHPADLSKRVAEPVQVPPPEPIKKPKMVVECTKNYLPNETENARKAELMGLTGGNLRKIHSALINDTSVLNSTPGVKTKEQLVHLILCLENEQKRVPAAAASVVEDDGPSTFQRILSTFKPTEIVERVEEPEKEAVVAPKPKLIIREPLSEPSLDEETKIDIETLIIEEQNVVEDVPVLDEPLKISEQEEKLQNKLGVAPTKIESKEYNSFLFNKEKLENENLRNLQD